MICLFRSADPDYGEELIEGGDVAQCDMEPGTVYRDWEPLPKEWTPVWRVYWGHSGGPHASAWEASQYASEVMGNFEADTVDEALAAVEADVGLRVRDSYVHHRGIHVLFEEEPE